MAAIDILRDVLSWVLFAAGAGAVVVGAVGLVRFPDFYARLHAAGVTDTAGAELVLIAMMLQSPSYLIVAKLLFISFFLFLTSPVATHAIAHAAWVEGVSPLLGRKLKYGDNPYSSGSSGARGKGGATGGSKAL